MAHGFLRTILHKVQATSGILRELLASAERIQTSPVVSLSREPDKQSIGTVALPPALVHMFLQAVDHLNKGQAIALMAFNPLLSTHQAAKLLGVSRPWSGARLTITRRERIGGSS